MNNLTRTQIIESIKRNLNIDDWCNEIPKLKHIVNNFIDEFLDEKKDVELLKLIKDYKIK